MPAQPPLFNSIAVLYQRYAEVNDDLYRPYLERSLPVTGGRAADLGCGSGRFTGLLADRCESVLAVDIAEREIELASRERARPDIEYRTASLLGVTPERDGLFDVVLSVNTLFSLFREHDRHRVLRHVRSLVSPGGSAVIVDVVSPGSRWAFRHRLWGLGETVRTLGRRRSVAAAWTVMRLRQHPVWLRHVRINRTLTREATHECYSTVFPGARFADDLDPFLCGVHWRNE